MEFRFSRNALMRALEPECGSKTQPLRGRTEKTVFCFNGVLSSTKHIHHAFRKPEFSGKTKRSAS
jgi:hypothetical protein